MPFCPLPDIKLHSPVHGPPRGRSLGSSDYCSYVQGGIHQYTVLQIWNGSISGGTCTYEIAFYGHSSKALDFDAIFSVSGDNVSCASLGATNGLVSGLDEDAVFIIGNG